MINVLICTIILASQLFWGFISKQSVIILTENVHKLSKDQLYLYIKPSNSNHPDARTYEKENLINCTSENQEFELLADCRVNYI